MSEFLRIKKITKKIILKAGNKTFGNYDYGKYVIITRARTGSNLLVALLSSHPNIHSHGELFNKTVNRSCSKIWNSTFCKKMN